MIDSLFFMVVIIICLQLNSLNCPLAHLYFELAFEELIEKSPMEVCSKIKQVSTVFVNDYV